MYPLKQSTALTVPIFVHDANGDGVTGLVDAGFTKRISKNGGAFAAMTVTITEMENGWYSLPLSTAHADTLGVLSVSISHASAKRVNLQFRVHALLPDDLATPTNITAATGVVLAATTHTGAVIPTVTTLTNLPAITANWITAAGITDGAFTAAKFAAASLNGKGDWNIGKTGYTLTQAFPANFASMAITAGGAVTAGTVSDKTGYSLTATTGLGNQTANITGNLSGSVGSVTGAVGSVTGAVTVGSINANAVTAAALATDAADEIGAAVWAVTSPISAKTYGLLVSETNAAQILRVAQFQAGSTTQALVLDASASAVDDFYNRTTITLVTGASAGQNRLINDYDGATRTAYLDRPLLVGAPASGAWFAIDSRGNTRSASDLRIGLAQGGGASTITLQATESASDDFFNRMFVLIESGTGEGQARLIDDYVGATKVATVARPWVVQPNNTSRYVILPFGSVKVSDIDPDAMNASALAADAVAEIADGVWDELLAGHLGAGSTGAALNGAGAAGDPWSTVLPGAYGAGTAGNIVGNRVDVATSTRLAAASYTAPDNATIAAIQADTNDIQGRLPAALVGGRMAANAEVVGDKTGYALTTGERTAVADALLTRDMSAVTGEAARSPINAFRFLRNKWTLAAGTLTVTKEDDATPAWTAAVSTDPAADPVTGSDPA